MDIITEEFYISKIKIVATSYLSYCEYVVMYEYFIDSEKIGDLRYTIENEEDLNFSKIAKNNLMNILSKRRKNFISSI